MLQQLYTAFRDGAGICTDTREMKKGDMFFALKGDIFNGNTFAAQALKEGAALAVVDEEEYHCGADTVLVPDVLTTLQALATHHREKLGTPIISLTGSNGKTTTKELIAAVLSKKYRTASTQGNYNNHIGVPLTLLSLDTNTEIGVVEMGANHHGEIAALCNIAKPNFGYITNFGKAHLEGFGSLEGVIKAKSELYDHLTAHQGMLFCNNDDAVQVSQIGDYDKKFCFSQEPRADIQIQLESSEPFVKARVGDRVIHSNLTGSYNFTNMAAAIAIGIYFEVPLKDIAHAIEKYVPSNNRSQMLEKGNYTVILDAYNANPTSMRAALENLAALESAYRIAFLGDMFELGDIAEEEHQEMVEYAESLPLDRITLIGKYFSSTRPTTSRVQQFPDFESFRDRFDITTLTEGTVLIKGSRGMALERILELF